MPGSGGEDEDAIAKTASMLIMQVVEVKLYIA